jgi:hypothetical protein
MTQPSLAVTHGGGSHARIPIVVQAGGHRGCGGAGCRWAARRAGRYGSGGDGGGVVSGPLGATSQLGVTASEVGGHLLWVMAGRASGFPFGPWQVIGQMQSPAILGTLRITGEGFSFAGVATVHHRRHHHRRRRTCRDRARRAGRVEPTRRRYRRGVARAGRGPAQRGGGLRSGSDGIGAHHRVPIAPRRTHLPANTRLTRREGASP